MSTAERKSHRVKLTHASEPQSRSSQAGSKARRPGRWLARLGLALLLLIGLVAIAPWIVAKTPLLQTIVRRTTKPLNGQIVVGTASLGWFSPVSVEGIVVHDASGKPIAWVDGITTDETLLALALAPRELGTIHLRRPRVECVVRESGSNIEDLIANYLTAPADPTSPGIDLALEIEEGTLLVRDETNGGQWQIGQLTAHVGLPAQSTWPLEVNLKGLVDQAEGPRPLGVVLSMQDVPLPTGGLCATGKGTLNVERLPLAMAQAGLRRWIPGLHVSGELSSNVDLEWGADAAGTRRVKLAGRSGIEQLVLIAPSLMQEQLRLRQLDLPCQLSIEGEQVQVDQLALTTDVGQLSFQGTLREISSIVSPATTQQRIDALLKAQTTLAGQVDLAKLAQLLPRTLRIRDDTQLLAGSVSLQLATQHDGSRAGLQGQLEASRLVAKHQGREFSWEQPLRLSLAAHEQNGHVTIDRLQCASDFLQVEGSGTPDELRVAGTCDLNRLTSELGKFVSLDGVRLAGQGKTNVTVKNGVDGRFDAQAEASIDHFELIWPQTAPWKEPQVTVKLNATGEHTEGTPRALSTGRLTIDAGSDQVVAVLSGPVAPLNESNVWPANLEVRGTIESWLRRVSPWFALPEGIELQGKIAATAQARYSTTGLELNQLQATSEMFDGKFYGTRIQEPQVRLSGDLRWLRATDQLEAREGLLVTSAGQVQLRDLMAGWGANPGATGKLALEGDLARFWQWWQDPQTPSTWSLTGRVQAQGQLTHTAGNTQLELDAAAQDVLATPRQGRQISEPVVKLGLKGVYSAEQDRVQIERCELAADAADIQLAGTIQAASKQREAELVGRVNYDLAKLTRFVQPYLGSNVQFSGRETRSFQLSGPLSSPVQAATPDQALFAAVQPLRGRADLGWQWANIYGLPLGKTDLQAELAGGLVRFKPSEIPLSNGRLRVAPDIRLGPGPIEMTHPPGTIIEQVEITPAMCQQWMAYVAPLLSGVAQASGKFSLAVDACRVPLDNAAQGDVVGRMTIHTMEIGPGPLIQELVVLLGGGSSARLARESVVPFRVVQGRVYHQNLELQMNDVTIRSQGSVGFDQTVALLIEMPVPARWIGTNPLLQGFKDQQIRLPIGGTLSRPQLDRRAFDQVAAELTRAAAENAIKREVNRGLDKLLGPLQNLK